MGKEKKVTFVKSKKPLLKGVSIRRSACLNISGRPVCGKCNLLILGNLQKWKDVSVADKRKKLMILGKVGPPASERSFSISWGIEWIMNPGPPLLFFHNSSTSRSSLFCFSAEQYIRSLCHTSPLQVGKCKFLSRIQMISFEMFQQVLAII